MTDYTEIRDDNIRSKICELMSEMLDNPDEYGIYPTSRFMWKMEAYCLELLAVKSIKIKKLQEQLKHSIQDPGLTEEEFAELGVTFGREGA